MVARRSTSTLALAALAAASACSLVYGPSTEELAGGAKTGASASSSSGTLPDASSTSSTTASSSSTSTSSSGGPDGGGFSCPAGSLLCADFESPLPPTMKNGTIEIVTGGHDSASALEAALLGGQPSPSLSAALSAPSHRATISFWFKPGGAVPHESISFRLAHALWGEACNWELSWQLSLRKDGVFAGTDTYDKQVQPSCGPVDFDDKPLLPAARVYDGNWHHVTVVLDASTKQRSAITQIDSEPAVTQTVESARRSLPTDVLFALGIPCIQEGGGCFEWQGPTYRVRFDDVSFATPP